MLITIIVIVILVIGVVLFFTIFKDEKSKFIGTWKNSSLGHTFTLYSDGTCYGTPALNILKSHGKWDVEDNRLVFYIGGSNNLTESYAFSFSNNDNTLTLSGGNLLKGDTNTYIYNKTTNETAPWSE